MLKRLLFAAALLLLPTLARAEVTNLTIYADKYNTSTLIRAVPASVMARVLAASTAETITAPAGARFVLFSSTCDFYALTGGTATVPSADVTNGSASELNPAAYALYGSAGEVSSISVITSATSCILTAAFYK